MRCTHFKALCKKNFISWRRTPVGSTAELACPIILMSLLLLLRQAFVAVTIPASLMYTNSTVLVPPVLDKGAGLEQNLMSMQSRNQHAYNFAGKQYGHRESAADCLSNYDPGRCTFLSEEFLAASPFNVDFSACQDDGGGGIAKDLVAVVHDDNEVALEFIDELEAFFAQQTKVHQLRTQDFIRKNGGSLENLPPQAKQVLAQKLPQPLDFEVRRFESQAALDEYLRDPLYLQREDKPGVCFGTVIMSAEDAEGYDIEIMMHDRLQQPRQRQLPFQTLDPFDTFISTPQLVLFKLYTDQGYSLIQNWLANIILKKKFPQADPASNPSIANVLVPMSSQQYVQDDFTQALNLMAFFMFLMFIVPVYRLAYRIVNEKETRARESMKMMGLTDTSYWLSWLAYYACVVFGISLISTFILASLAKSDSLLVFLLFFIFGLSLFGYAVIIQSLFNKASTAAGVTATVYFVSSFFDGLVNQPSSSHFAKTMASLLPPVAVNRIVYVLAVAENADGLTWTSAFQEYQNYVIAEGLLMMVLSFVLLTAFGLYLDNVIQSTYGTAKHPLFCLKRSFWLGAKARERVTISPGPDPERGDPATGEAYYLDQRNYEPVKNPELLGQEEELKILKVWGLKKRFGDFQAVDGVNLRMYSGQIFALLGHNGAGKTTTISMLTGLIPPTSGEARVYDKNLFADMDEVRNFMGVCPQHDILFDLLTPEEHLDVFCDFKGVEPAEKQKDIDQVLKDIDLEAWRSTRAEDLSGGSRRKLSVAIALVGGSKFILLDEPTAGLDLSARRKLWDMLKKYKGNRIMILTTHYMDEADILGDRVGIMTAGKITCLGRPLFLKNRFGVGYRLSMVKKSKDANEQVGVFLSQNLGPDVHMLSEVSSEITFQIPKDYSDKFKSFFE